MGFRSLYWRIGIGFVALLAVMLLVQALLFLYLTGPAEGWLPMRSPARLATLVASDVSEALASHPDLQLDKYVREQFSHVYMPVFVLLEDGRVASNREGPPPPGAMRALRGRARRLLDGQRPDRPQQGGTQPGPGRQGGTADNAQPGTAQTQRDALRRFDATRPPGEPPFGETAPIMVAGKRAGVVVVSNRGPQLYMLLRQFGPALGMAGIVLLVIGTTVGSLLIFRPARQRMRKLEEAAAALGAGRTSVRAPEGGSDEVAELARGFNRMAEALETSDSARRRLLADVSHELKTPLTAIRGFIETLCMDDVSLDEETRRRYLRIVDDETQKLGTIINDLLDLARLEGGAGTVEFRDVQLEPLFARVADRHAQELARKRVTLDARVSPGACDVWGDPSRLEQALQNLAANALRHTPDGGRIELRAEPAGSNVRVIVKDSGPGIDSEHLPRVFDRFYKVEASRSNGNQDAGSGLGLSIVKAIVERHRGSVTARNAPEGGAEFDLLLPSDACRDQKS